MRIRNYREGDKESLRRICVATAGESFGGDRAREELVCLLYNDYYTECEPMSIFVAVDEDDLPFGYILCAKRFWSFLGAMRTSYLPRAKALGLGSLGMYRLSILANIPFLGRYPAHLHIDILDGHQRQGIGHALMDALVAHLAEGHVRGLSLLVARENEKGISFYRKYGFKTLLATRSTLILGLKIGP